MDQFKRLGGRYIFSRIDLGNAEEIGLTLIGTYTDEASPYTLYVYQTTSRYRDVDHANLTLEEMKQTTCDMELLDAQLTEMKELAAEAEAAGEAKDPERVKELFAETLDEVEKPKTATFKILLANLNGFNLVLAATKSGYPTNRKARKRRVVATTYVMAGFRWWMP